MLNRQSSISAHPYRTLNVALMLAAALIGILLALGLRTFSEPGDNPLAPVVGQSAAQAAYIEQIPAETYAYFPSYFENQAKEIEGQPQPPTF